jgi:predicted Rossmann-fold nucleotide-binding protein
MVEELSAVAVYCGSNSGNDPAYAEAAAALGRALAKRGIRLVYGGGQVGLMADAADAFVMLPGGFGTLDEFFEVVTWTQLGIHAKPCGVLDAAGFFLPLRALVDGAVTAGFVRPAHRDMIVADDDPARLLDRLAAWTPVTVSKWLDPTER